MLHAALWFIDNDAPNVTGCSPWVHGTQQPVPATANGRWASLLVRPRKSFQALHPVPLHTEECLSPA